MVVAAGVECAGTMELVERSITIGDGTAYAWDNQGRITGLGNPQTRNSDVAKGQGDGDVPQHDFYGPRLLTMPVSIAPAPGESTTKAAIWALWRTLENAWTKSFDVDLTLIHTEPGHVDTYIGRPDSCALDDTLWRQGMPVLRVLLAFRCSDPTRY